MSSLAAKIRSQQFVVTSELTPPKGTDLSDLLAKAQALRSHVDAFNLTESHRARMATAPTPVARLLLERGIEPIVQMTARDRNRIAFQADLLGASVLGVRNFIFMGGDPPANGDHPEAKPVFDLHANQMLAAARGLCEGHDMAGHPLRGAPTMFLGATANPGAADLDTEMLNVYRKIDAGAEFIQTQAIYEPATVRALPRGREAAQGGDPGRHHSTEVRENGGLAQRQRPRDSRARAAHRGNGRRGGRGGADPHGHRNRGADDPRRAQSVRRRTCHGDRLGKPRAGHS